MNKAQIQVPRLCICHKYCHNVCYRSDDYGTVQLSQVTHAKLKSLALFQGSLYSMSGDLRKTGQALLLAQSRLITACLLLAHGLAHQLHGLPHLAHGLAHLVHGLPHQLLRGLDRRVRRRRLAQLPANSLHRLTRC